LELHTEYKIVIEYGTKYKCTDFIAKYGSLWNIKTKSISHVFQKQFESSKI